MLAVRTENIWHVAEEGGRRHPSSENPSSPLCVHIGLKNVNSFFFFSFLQEADFFSGNPGYTDPGIQVEEFSTVTSGKG